MKKVLCLALVITSLFIIPVSAEESVFIGDWGVGTVYNRTEHEIISTASVIKQFPFNSSVDRSPYYFFQFDWKPNYTYRVIATFDFTGAFTYFRTGYDIFKSPGYSIRSSTPTYDAITWNDVVQLQNKDDDLHTPFSITYNTITGDTSYLEIEIVFDNDIVMLSSLDYVILRSIYVWSNSYSVSNWNYQVEAYEDPNNDIYNELILNQLNTISGQLNDIINSGSDQTSSIPTNGDELSSAVNDLDNAEEELYNKSDDLIANVQTQLEESKNQAVAALPNLSTSALAVTNVYNMIKATLPDEVKILFVVVPVILFFAYLIGRKD